MRHPLRDAVVVITGASSGIGRECALQFARQGARLVLAARREDRLRFLAQEISPNAPLILPLDLSVPSNAESLVEQAAAHFGRIDILVNNAGYTQVDRFETMTPEDLRRLLEVNFFSPALAIHAVIPVMRRQRSGHIINVSSVIGRRGIPLYSTYCAAKGALSRLTESLRVELAGSGIDVSLISPGMTKTEFTQAAQSAQALNAKLPQGGMSAAKVARAIVRTAEHPRREVVLTASGRALIWISRLSPPLLDRALLFFRNRLLNDLPGDRKSL